MMLHIFGKPISLLVFDMAGTIIQERGFIYKSMVNVLQSMNCAVAEKDVLRWKGRAKQEVLNEMINKTYPAASREKMLQIASQNLKEQLQSEYTADNISMIHPHAINTLHNLRKRGVKVALNTGYPKDIQDQIISELNLDKCIDASISSDCVINSRPHPAMIHRLMDKLNIPNIEHVGKVGDTVIDVQEGMNAGCGLVVGVLSGGTPSKDLYPYSHAIIPDITDIFTSQVLLAKQVPNNPYNAKFRHPFQSPYPFTVP